MDIVGPLPTSHSHNRYIVSMIDSFSRYCMLVPVKSVTAMDVVHAIDRWITTFGPPKSILSDNGPQFI
ncbi:MAG: transposase family protein, partial [Colwellia sp.]|nr:transposase family protein [Colwellia sp.]